MNSRSALSLLLLAVPFTAPLAARPASAALVARGAGAQGGALAVAERGETESARLQLALDAITAEKVRHDIFFIASDELGGRDTPSLGQRIAARFIRNRLERLGWQPGAADGYFYEYSLPRRGTDEARDFAEWRGEGGAQGWKVGVDYVVSPQAFADRDATGRVVYVGGFEEEEVAGLELSGAWGLAAPGTRLSRRRLQEAHERGLLGFLVPPGPDEESTVLERHARTLSFMRRTSLGGSRRGSSDPAAAVLYLTEDCAARIDALAARKPGDALAATLRESFAYGQIDEVTLENVCGLWPGSDPVLRNEVIIVSAHYDHVGTQGDDIYNGADDNGSGTTGLLAIAEALAVHGPLRRSVLLLWVSGEEKGLLGSDAWTKAPWLPEGMHAVCDLNIDMIGRNAPDEIGVTPTRAREEYNRLTQLVEEHLAEEGFTKLNSADEYWGRSDHANFSRNMDLPVAFLFSDVHEDYHKPTDTPDKIDCDKVRRVCRLVVRMLADLQEDELDLRLPASVPQDLPVAPGRPGGG